MADEKKKTAKGLIVTLPDGRNKTNLKVLIRTKEAKEHFKAINQLVKEEKRKKAAQG